MVWIWGGMYEDVEERFVVYLLRFRPMNKYCSVYVASN